MKESERIESELERGGNEERPTHPRTHAHQTHEDKATLHTEYRKHRQKLKVKEREKEWE